VSDAGVLVSGASTGIGRACALELDRLGYRVFAGVRRPADADALSRAAGPRLLPVTLDVTDGANIAAAEKLVRSQLHGAPFLGLVNNAGIAVGGPLEFIALDDWRRQLEVNVVGQVAMIQQFLPLIRTHRGRIVNISSVGGRVAQPFLAPYVASKHAIEAISDALRVELRPWRIEVCLVEPGSVATPIWAKGSEAVAALTGAAPRRVLELYGRALNTMSGVVRRTEAAGVPPERVASAVVHALTDRRPKTRYVVGRDTQLLILLRTLLPDRWRDELMLRYTGLPRDEDSVADTPRTSGANGVPARRSRRGTGRRTASPARSR
jgi:NAD(P)-dependent dehydrogenase (short-subunit alcohol dehydrogenase family)